MIEKLFLFHFDKVENKNYTNILFIVSGKLQDINLHYN
jgi:hypothetical protein